MNIGLAAISEAALDALPAGVLVLDENGTVQIANEAATSMLVGPLVGAVWRDVIGRSFVLSVASGNDDLALVDGRKVNINTCPLGERPGQILLLHDVTELTKLREQVTRQERLSALGEVSASLAHQIRTPLSTALLYAEQVANTSDQQKRSRSGSALKRALGSIESLVRDMLMFVRGEVLDAQYLELSELLKRLQTSLQPQLQNIDVSVSEPPTSGETAILGNADALLTILQNLIMNSVESGATLIHIELARVGPGRAQHVLLTVSDNGPGIPDSLRKQVFEPFFTTRANGTGLGLAVVRNVIRAHGGDVELDECQEQGCRVCIRLPLAATNPAAVTSKIA